MISMELQREVPQYMAIPWLMTWVMARTVSAGREGESGRWGLAGAALAEGAHSMLMAGEHPTAQCCGGSWVVSRGCFQKSRMGTEGAATQDVPGTTANLTCSHGARLSLHGEQPESSASGPMPCGVTSTSTAAGGRTDALPIHRDPWREA